MLMKRIYVKDGGRERLWGGTPQVILTMYIFSRKNRYYQLVVAVSRLYNKKKEDKIKQNFITKALYSYCNEILS